MTKFSERTRRVHQSEDVDTIDYISSDYAAQSISDGRAVHITLDLERLIDKVYRFYESGDYEEVILNAVKIERLYAVCLRDEYRRYGRHLFNLDLKFRIDHDAKFLRSLYEDLTNVELGTSRITPEYARRAVNISNDMYDYITTYIKDVPPARKVDRSEERELIEAPNHMDYPVSHIHDVGDERFEELNELDLSDYRVLFVGRQSFFNLLTKSSRLIALSCFLLIASIPVANFATGITALPEVLRAVAVAILLYVAARIFLGTYSEQYIITTDEILIKRGVVFKKTVKAPIDLIIKQRMKQPFLGKILNFGNIFFGIYGGRSLVFKGVSDPKFVCDLVRRIWHDRKRRPY